MADALKYEQRGNCSLLQSIDKKKQRLRRYVWLNRYATIKNISVQTDHESSVTSFTPQRTVYILRSSAERQWSFLTNAFHSKITGVPTLKSFVLATPYNTEKLHWMYINWLLTCCLLQIITFFSIEKLCRQILKRICMYLGFKCLYSINTFCDKFPCIIVRI